MQQHILICVAVICAVVGGAAGHGGHLHEYPKTPSGSNYIRTKIATCSSWVPADGPVKYSLVGSNTQQPAAATAANKPVVKGDVTVWQYLYKNCSLTDDSPVPSAGVEFNVTLSSNGKPLSNITLDGTAMTGSCASGGGAPFYFDPEANPVDDAENLLWFHNFTVPKSGVVHGNGANDGPVLTSPAGRGIKSIMLINTNTKVALACCDLTLAGAATNDWAATLADKGVNCSSEEPSEASTVGAHTTTDKHSSNSSGDSSNTTDLASSNQTATAAAGKPSGSAAASTGASSAAVLGVAAVLAAVVLL